MSMKSGDGGTVGSPRQHLMPIETARVLHQTLEELQRVRKQLRQPFSDKATVEAAINRLESGLRAQSHELWVAAARQAATQPAPAPVQTGNVFKEGPAKKPLPPIAPSASERVAQQKADFLHKPQTDAARAYLQDRFGIAPPTKLQPSLQPPVQGSTIGGSMSKGLTSAAGPGVILPKAYRDDPYANVPAKFMDMELEKGLFHLVNRGLLPSKSDLSPALMGDLGPVRMGGAALHPPATQWIKPPPTSALEDALLAGPAFKLDLLTPVVKPLQDTFKNNALHITFVGQQGSSGGAGGQHGAGDAVGGAGGAARAAELADARPYDVLMDTFSLHEFMIRKGALISNTPEFDSYQRTYEPLWPVIGPLITQLESLSKQYAVPLVIVDGRSLADLAHGVMESSVPPQMQDLLVCVQNIQEVASLLRQPGRRFQGENGHQDAATAIQAVWRGHRSRTRYSRHGLAASTIQGAWRMHRMRGQLAEKLTAARAACASRFAELQQQLYTQWPLFHVNPHVIVHLPSMRRPQPSTLSQKDDLLLAEAAQMARLTDLAEPLVEVVLVLPGPPNPDVVAYWDKILEVGGVPGASSRYRIIWPDNYSRLPAHMSTAAMLMASPKTLKRLKSVVSGRLGYMVPGLAADEEVDLAVALGLPMLAPAAHATRALCHKSAARALFQASGVHVAPGMCLVPRSQVPPPPPRKGPNGVHPITEHTDFEFTEDGELVVEERPPPPGPPTRTQYEIDEERVLELLAEAAIRWPYMVQWVIKVDDEVGNGAGHATFNLTTIPGAMDVLTRTAQECKVAGISPPPSAGPLPPLSEAQKVSRYRMGQLLYRHLPDKLQAAQKEVYPTYRDYVSAVASRGGVVEAYPLHLLGSPQANILVDPTGHVAVLSTHEKIFISPFRSVGSTFPQSSVQPRAIMDAALSIGSACFQAGIIGHLAVDFVTLLEPKGSAGGGAKQPAVRLWGVDVTPCATPSLMAFQLFDFLTVGSWDPATGRYVVDQDEQQGEEGQSTGEALGAARIQGVSCAGSINPFAASTPGDKPDSYPMSPLIPEEALKTKLSFLQTGALDELHAPPAPPAPPRPADDGMLGVRPSTADMPSGVPSPHNSSSAASSYATTPERWRQQHQSAQNLAQAAVWSAGSRSTGGGAYTPSSAEAENCTVGSNLSQRTSINTCQLKDFSTHNSVQASPIPGQEDSADEAASIVTTTTHHDDGRYSVQAAPQIQRFFFSLDTLSHPALAATPCTRFFRSCWQDGLHFDVDARTGVIFNLSDKYLLGSLGVITVGLAPYHVMSLMHKALHFINVMDQQSGTRPKGGRDVGVVDPRGFREVQMLVKYMADKTAQLLQAAGTPASALTV